MKSYEDSGSLCLCVQILALPASNQWLRGVQHMQTWIGLKKIVVGLQKSFKFGLRFVQFIHYL